MRHHRLRLILLSRIDGDAPRALIDQRRRLEVREQACFTLRSRSFESTRTWSFDRYRFAEAHPIRSFFFIPNKGKGISLCLQNFMLETLLSKPPIRSSSSCLVRPARFNLPASWKTATLGAREALPSWKCPARQKLHQRLINSMARNLVVGP